MKWYDAVSCGLLLVVLVLLGVVLYYDSVHGRVRPPEFNGVPIVRVRGCEYLETSGGGAYYFEHAGDCDNPIHRTTTR